MIALETLEHYYNTFYRISNLTFDSQNDMYYLMTFSIFHACCKEKTDVTYLHTGSWKIISAIHDTLDSYLTRRTRCDFVSKFVASNIDHRFVTHFEEIYRDLQWERDSAKVVDRLTNVTKMSTRLKQA